MNLPRILVAAPASGGGKTTLACGLLQLLTERGLRPAAFKCGPDFIDPLFHREIIGAASANLDLFFTGEETVRGLMLRGSEGCGMAVLEGVMGYYDGLGGVSERAGSFHLARATGTPAVLAVDVRGASLSLAALVKGFLEFRRPSGIRALFLNRCSQPLFSLLRPMLEQETGLPVLGYLPPSPELALESRHLGLVTPQDAERLREKLGKLAALLRGTLDLDRLLELAGQAPPVEAALPRAACLTGDRPVRLAVARDRAFCFYYQESLALLEELGAQLVPFSPLRDDALPQGVHGLYLGGGYPELWAEQLAGNSFMRRSVRQAVAAGLPTLAECGGFLYLLENLKTEDGHIFPMAGVFSGESGKGQRLGNFGYLTLTAEEDLPFLKKGMSMKGHEFHYWQTNDQGAGACARKPAGNKEWLCMRNYKNTLAGFPHLYYRSCPEFIAEFARCCRDYRMGRI